MLAGWQVITLATVAVLVIFAIVWHVHGARAASVMLALSGAALLCVWVSYEVLPVEQWRRGSLVNGLLIFALPAAAAVAIALARARGRSRSAPPRSPAGQPGTRLTRDAWLFLVLPWVTPAALLFVSQWQPAVGGADPDFANSMWWAASTIALYVGVPVAYAAIARQSVRGYGLSLKFARTEGALVLLIAPVALVMVWLISADARFLQTYPFYDVSAGGDGAWLKLLVFEAAYGATFVALEFFFRGFLVFAGMPVLGIHAVPVMAFAYCLLHLGKPMPECASSLVGGLILGYLAVRFRSIAVGVVAHLTIAWGMDASVLGRR